MKKMWNWRETVNRWPAALSVALLATLAGLTCQSAKRPSVPVVTGPDAGVAGMPLTFKATSEDPNGDSVAFMFDWGDTTTKVWTNYIPSDETISVSHTYADSGNYTVKAKAKNGIVVESGWSEGEVVVLVGKGVGYPDSLAAVVQLGAGGPIPALAISPDGQFLYVVSYSDSRLFVVRTGDYAVVDTLDVGRNPYALAFAPDGRWLYVALAGSESVAVVHTQDNSLSAMVAVGRGPEDLAIAPAGDYLYVAVTREDSVAKVQTSSNSVVQKIPTDLSPTALAIDSHGGVLYVASPIESTVTSIDVTSGATNARLKLGYYVVALGLSRDERKLYAGLDDGRVVVVNSDLSGTTRDIQLYGTPRDVVLTSDGEYVLVPSDEHHGLSVIRTDRDILAGWLGAGGVFGSVAVAPDGSRIFAADDHTMSVSVFRRSSESE